MKKLWSFITTICLTLTISLSSGQVTTKELNDSLTSISFFPDTCNCLTSDFLLDNLTEKQILEYQKAQLKADSLTKTDYPCYEYEATFFCATLFEKLFFESIDNYQPTDSLDNNQMCQDYQITIQRQRRSRIMTTDHGGTYFCPEDLKNTRN